MMRTLFPVSAWMLIALLSFSAQAEWYESNGWAPIINNDVDSARARAVEMALRQSLDFAGGHVQSVEEVVDGVLTGRQMQWHTQGAIEHAELVRERTSGQRLEVTLRANIRQTNAQCTAENFRKNVVVVPFELQHSEQARHGDIWDLGDAASQRLARMIGQHSRQLVLTHRSGQEAGFTGFLRSPTTQQMAQFARRVALQNNSQYVIAGVLNDISTFPRSQRNWTFWSHPPYDRNMRLTLYLFDGASGALVTRAAIEEQQQWSYTYTERADVFSQDFWNRDYGVVLLQRMQDIVYGFDDKLRCEPMHGRVVNVSGENIHVNLGSRNGLSEGDVLQLHHRGNFFDAQGHYHEQWVLSPYELEVTQVQQSSASTRVRGNQTGTNIQPNDQVRIR